MFSFTPPCPRQYHNNRNWHTDSPINRRRYHGKTAFGYEPTTCTSIGWCQPTVLCHCVWLKLSLHWSNNWELDSRCWFVSANQNAHTGETPGTHVLFAHNSACMIRACWWHLVPMFFSRTIVGSISPKNYFVISRRLFHNVWEIISACFSKRLIPPFRGIFRSTFQIPSGD